jgi:hypothetical protein
MSTPHDVHMFASPERKRWMVRQGRQTMSCHRIQSQAVRAAIREARRDCVGVTTDGRSGRIRSRDSYGDEPPEAG